MSKKEIQDYILHIRRYLHQIPEVGICLPKTSAYIKDELDALGISYEESTTDSGLCATIDGGFDGPTIVFRADMDALAVKEENEVEYVSRHEGRMHACGHDAHMAILLGTARVLSAQKETLHGRVKLIFQTGEEIAKGAELAIQNGYVDNADAIFGLHVGSLFGKDISSGTMIAAPGCIMASYDQFKLKVRGMSCHGSSPEKGVDPIQIAAHIILNLQAIQTREMSGTTSSVLTIGKIHGGTQYNIIPEIVEMEGTIRTTDEKVRQYLAERIEQIASLTARTFGAECDCEMVWGAPPVINHPKMTKLAEDALIEIFGAEWVRNKMDAPNMAGEDFANYLKIVPGAFLYLSTSDEEKETDYPHHNARFNVDEDVLWRGVASFEAIAKKILK